MTIVAATVLSVVVPQSAAAATSMRNGQGNASAYKPLTGLVGTILIKSPGKWIKYVFSGKHVGAVNGYSWSGAFDEDIGNEPGCIIAQGSGRGTVTPQGANAMSLQGSRSKLYINWRPPTMDGQKTVHCNDGEAPGPYTDLVPVGTLWLYSLKGVNKKTDPPFTITWSLSFTKK